MSVTKEPANLRNLTRVKIIKTTGTAAKIYPVLFATESIPEVVRLLNLQNNFLRRKETGDEILHLAILGREVLKHGLPCTPEELEQVERDVIALISLNGGTKK
jgi:hypothetical protein